MGAFNKLKTDIKCENCSHLFAVNIQFKFGDTWQYEMVIGDEIKWGGNDKGEPGNATVMVYGMAEDANCRECGFANQEEFDILIKDNVISKVSTMASIDKYIDDNWYS
jgi:hypothetical protein